MTLPRYKLRILIAILSGSNTLNRALFKMNLIDSPLCKCRLFEESSFHVLAECMCFYRLRSDWFGSQTLTLEEVNEIP